MTLFLIYIRNLVKADRSRNPVIHPKPATSKSARTRGRILAAAAEVLAERGYASTTLEEIAVRADMRAGSLYYHFASKDELVASVLEAGVAGARDAVLAATTALGEDADPVERIRVAVRAHLRAILAQGSLTKANIRGYGQVPRHVADRLTTAWQDYGDVWRVLVDAAVAGGHIRSDLDPSVVRLLLIGAMNWSVEWFTAEGPLDSEEVADHLLAMALDGLLPGAA